MFVYTLRYKKYYETEVKYNETANLSYILTDLSSGSVYEIWLTAWTSKQSIKSASINITTMIGSEYNNESINS